MKVVKENKNSLTIEVMKNLQTAYDFFNEELFEGKLGPCLITLSDKRKEYGFFRAKAIRDNDGKVFHQIALNPLHFGNNRDDEKTLSTMVHEQVHLWQKDYGKPSRSYHHNLEWAKKMESIGLMPSNTGMPGGKRVGQKVSHYIKENGPYSVAYTKFKKEIGITSNFTLALKAKGPGLIPPGIDPETGEKVKLKNSGPARYTCPECESYVTGKKGLNIQCADCDRSMNCNR